MVSSPAPDEKALVVMMKPDGVRRCCTPSESNRIFTSWQSLLRWLRGADPDELPHPDIVSEVARKAALRMPRFPDYDLNLWVQQARAIEPAHTMRAFRGGPLPAITHQVLGDLPIRLTARLTGRLSAQMIEILYGRAKSFQDNRELLVPRLLEGPVSLGIWHGTGKNLALGAKFIIRRTLSASMLTNLIHMDLVDAATVDEIVAGWRSHD